jgi:hypothetical protein
MQIKSFQYTIFSIHQQPLPVPQNTKPITENSNLHK